MNNRKPGKWQPRYVLRQKQDQKALMNIVTRHRLNFGIIAIAGTTPIYALFPGSKWKKK